MDTSTARIRSAVVLERWPALARAWWALPLAIALASRLYSVAWVLLGTALTPRENLHAEGLTIYDGTWYLRIATTGYHAEGVPGQFGEYHDYAFFPGWPVLIAVLARIVPLPVGTVAALAANILFCAAAVAGWRLVDRRFGRQAATWGLALLAFSPAAYVFSLAYSEALFLLVAVLALATPLPSGRRALLAAAAQAIRLPGFAIGATALATLRARPGPSLLVLAAPLLVLVAWWAFIAHLTGDPLGYLRGTPSWWAVIGTPTGPLSWRVVVMDAASRHVPVDAFSPIVVVLLTTMLGIASLGLLLERRSRDLGWYCLALMVPTVLLANWEQWPRHSLLAVPAFAFLADRLPRRAVILLVPAFAAVQAVFVMQVTHARMTP